MTQLNAVPDESAEPFALGDGSIETPAYFEAFGLSLGIQGGVVRTVDIDNGMYDD